MELPIFLFTKIRAPFDWKGRLRLKSHAYSSETPTNFLFTITSSQQSVSPIHLNTSYSEIGTQIERLDLSSQKTPLSPCQKTQAPTFTQTCNPRIPLIACSNHIPATSATTLNIFTNRPDLPFLWNSVLIELKMRGPRKVLNICS